MEIIRSATFEGMADKNGFPTAEYLKLYETLAKNDVKNIITGFMFISNEGRAMQAGQAGLDKEEKIYAFQKITDAVHHYGSKIIAQIAHTGRQTTKTGYKIVGVSSKKSMYFNETPHRLTTNEIYEVIQQFADSAYYAKAAGFDGIQLHAAHGYLIHQFLIKSINNRTDEFKEGTLFFKKIIESIKTKCGSFPIWVKVSGDVDIEKNHQTQFLKVIQLLDELKVDLIEVSYGTMDYALNIIRGSIPVKSVFKLNPIYKNKGLLWRIFNVPVIISKLIPYAPQYNLKYAKLAEKYTNIPISAVGGFSTLAEAQDCGLPYVSLCRPLICEPDFLVKSKNHSSYISKCTKCNVCAIMTDTDQLLKCFGGMKNDGRKSI